MIEKYMKRKSARKKGTRVALGRWPGAGPKGTQKGMLTKRGKALKVTLPTTNVRWPDGKAVLAGELEEGAEYEYNFLTGIIKPKG